MRTESEATVSRASRLGRIVAAAVPCGAGRGGRGRRAARLRSKMSLASVLFAVAVADADAVRKPSQSENHHTRETLPVRKPSHSGNSPSQKTISLGKPITLAVFASTTPTAESSNPTTPQPTTRKPLHSRPTSERSPDPIQRSNSSRNAATVRSKPVSRSTLGSQSSRSRAFEMSGFRTCGSSSGRSR